mgnify:CR=1 FL=1
MSSLTPTRCVSLEGHASTVLGEAAGTLITCLSGCVWITRYGDPRDVILHTGSRFEVDGPGTVVMTAHHGARLHITPPRGDARPDRAGGLAGFLRRLLRNPLRPRWQSAARRLAGGSMREC